MGQPYRALILPELFGRILSAIFGSLAKGAESRKRLNREIEPFGLETTGASECLLPRDNRRGR